MKAEGQAADRKGTGGSCKASEQVEYLYYRICKSYTSRFPTEHTPSRWGQTEAAGSRRQAVALNKP